MLTVYRADSYHSAAAALIGKLKDVDPADLNNRHIVISGVKTSMSSEFQVLDALNGSFNTEVMTFARLTNKLLPGKSFISKQSAVMILTKIIASLRSDLKCFKASSLTAGFAEMMFETITQLKYSNISPDALNKDGLPDGLKEKVRDISLIYKTYEDFNGNRFIDSGSKMRLLADEIPKSDFVKNSYFYVKDFDYFTVQEALILRQLLNFSKGVTAAVVYSKKPEHKNLFLNEAYSTLENIAKGLGVEPEFIDAPATHTGFVSHIASNLYASEKACRTVKEVEQDKLAVHSAGNIFDEVTRAAAYIKSKIASGARYKDFLVVAGDTKKYSYAVSQIFGEYGLSFFLDSKKRLYDHALARYILSALEMKKNNFAFRDVAAFVKNCFFDADDTEKFEFENYCLKLNIKYCAAAFDAATAGYAGAKSAEKPLASQLEKMRAEAVGAGAGLDLKKTDSVCNYAAAVKKFLAAQKAEEKLNNFISNQTETDLLESKFSAQVWEKLNSVLDTAGTLLGGEPVSIEAFVKMLESGFKAVEISILPLYNDCIVVSDLSKARAQAHKHLVVLGANEGIFPLVKSDTKLISDRNIEELERCGVLIYPKVRAENRRERFNVYQLLIEPRDSVYISFLAAGEDKEAALPSGAVDEIVEMFALNGKTPYPVFLVEQEHRVYSKGRARRAAVAGARSFLDNAGSKSGAGQISELIEALDEKNVIDFVYRKKPKQNINGADKLLLPNGTVSVTKIETFYECPYKYFWQSGVKLRKRPDGELRRLDTGNIFHEALEKFVGGLPADGTESGVKAASRADGIFDRIVERDEYKNFFKVGKSGFSVLRLKNEVVSTCLKVKRQIENSDFKPQFQEWAFGFDDSSALVINTPDGSVRLNGKIDRIDTCGDKFIIIDYKSGSREVKFSESGLYEGQILQLLIYVKAYIEKSKASPAGFYYMQTYERFADRPQQLKFNGRTLADADAVSALDKSARDEGSSGLLGIEFGKDGEVKKGLSAVSAEQIETMLDYAVTLIENAVSDIASGFIDASPREGACVFCDFKDACTFEDFCAPDARKEYSGVTADNLTEIVKCRKC